MIRHYVLYDINSCTKLEIETYVDGVYVNTVNGAKLRNKLTFGLVCYNAKKEFPDIIQLERHKPGEP